MWNFLQGLIIIVATLCSALNEISYTFRYAVEAEGVVTQHWEERHQDIVHGSYSFLEPDGKIRTVDYQVNGRDGFKAVVTYRNPPGYPLVGHLKFPEYYRRPLILARPVGLITNDLFEHKPNKYSNS